MNKAIASATVVCAVLHLSSVKAQEGYTPGNTIIQLGKVHKPYAEQDGDSQTGNLPTPNTNSTSGRTYATPTPVRSSSASSSLPEKSNKTNKTKARKVVGSGPSKAYSSIYSNVDSDTGVAANVPDNVSNSAASGAANSAAISAASGSANSAANSAASGSANSVPNNVSSSIPNNTANVPQSSGAGNRFNGVAKHAGALLRGLPAVLGIPYANRVNIPNGAAASSSVYGNGTGTQSVTGGIPVFRNLARGNSGHPGTGTGAAANAGEFPIPTGANDLETFDLPDISQRAYGGFVQRQFRTGVGGSGLIGPH